jgi:hypothetical protein
MLLLLAAPTHVPPHPVSPTDQALFVPYLIAALIFSFVPTWIALFQRHPDARKIFLINLFLGWTVIGWIVALVIAVRGPYRQYRPVVEPYICRNCYTVGVPNFRRRQWFFGTGAWNAAKLYSAVAPVSTCPRCHAPNPIPLNTPAGREIAARTRISL